MMKDKENINYKCCYNCKHVKRGKPCDNEGQLHMVKEAKGNAKNKQSFVCHNWRRKDEK